MNKYVSAIIDTIAFVAGIAVSILFGNSNQPNLLVISAVFLATRAFFYQIFYLKSLATKVPWKKFLINSAILILILPIFIASTGIIFQSISNLIYWFIIVPIVVLLVSFSIHRLYSI